MTVTTKEWTDQINQLIYRIQRQDESALQQLYYLAGSKLLGVISRIVRDPQEAEDTLQTAFLKIWQKAHQFTGSGSAWGWCCVLARNCALDQIRCSNQHRYVSTDEYQDLLNHLSCQQDNADLHSVLRCLDDLKAQPKQSVLMSFVYGYSHSELAEKMAVKLGTIKTWIRRSLIELKQCLEA